MAQLRLVFPLLQRNQPSRRSFTWISRLLKSTLNRFRVFALQQSKGAT